MAFKYFIKIIVVYIFVLFSFSIHADEITVFYKEGQTIKNEEIAVKNGHEILFLQMDLLSSLENDVSKAVTNFHQKAIDDFTKLHGKQKLQFLKEDELANLFINHFSSAGIDFSTDAMSFIDNDKVNKAIKITEYAHEQGVTDEMLPALIFKGELYRNVSSFDFLFNREHK